MTRFEAGKPDPTRSLGTAPHAVEVGSAEVDGGGHARARERTCDRSRGTGGRCEAERKEPEKNRVQEGMAHRGISMMWGPAAWSPRVVYGKHSHPTASKSSGKSCRVPSGGFGYGCRPLDRICVASAGPGRGRDQRWGTAHRNHALVATADFPALPLGQPGCTRQAGIDYDASLRGLGIVRVSGWLNRSTRRCCGTPRRPCKRHSRAAGDARKCGVKCGVSSGAILHWRDRA